MSKLDDLEKIQELKNKGILTQEEFENEKQKILNIKKDINSEETNNHINEVNVNKKKKILYILIPILIIILILVIILLINSKNIISTENKDTDKIDDDNKTQYDNEISDEISIEYNKKYKLKEVGVIDSYIIFENNHFEICYKGNDYITYSQGDYTQDAEKITFKVLKEGYTSENSMRGQKFEEEKIGTISDAGKTITILNENPEENMIYELSEETATMKEIILEDENMSQTTSEQTDNSQTSYNDISLEKNNANSNTKNNSQQETIQVPWFSYLGESVEYYTNKLKEAGISYKIEKIQDLNYNTGTVRDIEYNGEKIKKGTTITITVVDNSEYIYDMEVWVNTKYLLELVNLNYTYQEKNKVNLLIKINNVEICNGEFTRESYSTSPIQVGNYKGKKDNLKFDITIEGKKVTQSVNYIFKDKMYSDKPAIVIYKGGDMGPLG